LRLCAVFTFIGEQLAVGRLGVVIDGGVRDVIATQRVAVTAGVPVLCAWRLRLPARSPTFRQPPPWAILPSFLPSRCTSSPGGCIRSGAPPGRWDGQASAVVLSGIASAPGARSTDANRYSQIGIWLWPTFTAKCLMAQPCWQIRVARRSSDLPLGQSVGNVR